MKFTYVQAGSRDSYQVPLSLQEGGLLGGICHRSLRLWKYAISVIDTLRLWDVQVGELAILKGGTRMLQANAISLIYAEVFFRPMYQE